MFPSLLIVDDEPTYDVRFNALELWPNSADPAFVHVGVFQSYLVQADKTRAI